MALCPSCNKKSLDPILKSSPFLIIKESLTQNEYDQSLPFTLSGKNKYGHEEHTTSYYLMKELGLAGINMQIMSLSAFWMHTPPKSVGRQSKESKEAFQKCLDWSISEIIRISENKKIILMMGAEIIKTFIGHGSNEVYGLVCKSDLLPHVPVIIPAPNPENIMKSPIGELRNALRVFSEQIKIYKQYSGLN